MTIEKLKTNYEKACMAYVKEFEKKQELDFDYWVAGNIGSGAMFGDFYFTMNDIVYDINNNIENGLIIKWYYDCEDNCLKSINYPSYYRGLRFEDLT